MRVLVTGAGGQLGKTIEELYANNTLDLDFYFATSTDLDITNKTSITTLFNKHNFNYCINCAAYTNVEKAEKIPEAAYKVNAEGVKNLAEVCKVINTVLIHISTDYVFDGEKKEPYAITDLPNPINEYGKSKLLGEQHIQSIMEQFFIVRTSWLYSKKYGKNFYRTILKNAILKKELYVTDNQQGCPTNTISLSKSIISLITTKESYGIVHYSDKEVMTWYGFAKLILMENNLSNQIKLEKADNYVTLAKRPKYGVLVNLN